MSCKELNYSAAGKRTPSPSAKISKCFINKSQYKNKVGSLTLLVGKLTRHRSILVINQRIIKADETFTVTGAFYQLTGLCIDQCILSADNVLSVTSAFYQLFEFYSDQCILSADEALQ